MRSPVTWSRRRDSRGVRLLGPGQATARRRREQPGPTPLIDDAAPDTMLTEAPPSSAARRRRRSVQLRRGPVHVRVHRRRRDPGGVHVAVHPQRSRRPAQLHVAIDRSGNPGRDPAEHLWSLDLTAPDTSITEQPAGGGHSSMVRFSFHLRGGQVTFDCSVDATGSRRATAGRRSAPFATARTRRGPRGSIGAATSMRPRLLFAWSVDTSTPAPMSDRPDRLDRGDERERSRSCPRRRRGRHVHRALDGGGFTACTSPKTVSGLGEGNHTFAVRVRDAVGNVDPTPATRT